MIRRSDLHGALRHAEGEFQAAAAGLGVEPSLDPSSADAIGLGLEFWPGDQRQLRRIAEGQVHSHDHPHESSPLTGLESTGLDVSGRREAAYPVINTERRPVGKVPSASLEP